MKIIKIFILFSIILILLSSDFLIAKPQFVVTINPVKYILSEIVGNKAEIIRLVPMGASPHTYLPKPSQVYKSVNSKALFYVSNNLDHWVKSIPAKQKIELINLLPKKNKLWFNSKRGIVDPHFWTDPLTVRALIPNLVKILIKLNPKNKEQYVKRSKIFSDQLLKLNKRIFAMLHKFKGEHIYLFHPSFKYFLNRYGLIYAGAIEEIPGKEPTPKYIQQLVGSIKKSGANAIFTEPQLSRRPAKIIAEASNSKIYYLDPIGNKKIRNYEDLILYNAKVFKKALSN